MPLLLTSFYMYWRLSVLQDIYMKYMGSIIKRRKLEKRKAETCKESREGPSTL
jgi:hypothetical protein